MTWPLIIKAGGELWEADCLPAAVAAVVGREYMDVLTVDAAWHMRVNSARQIAALMGASGIPAIVRDMDNLMADNRLCPPDEAGEMAEVEWQDRGPVVLWAHPDRAFVLSLLEAGIIMVAERPGSYILRDGPPWAGLIGQGCDRCRYMRKAVCEMYKGRVPDDNGVNCPAFVPPGGEEGGRGQYTDLVTVPVARAQWQTADAKALESLADYSRWWDVGVEKQRS